MPVMRRVTANGVQLNVAIAGEGPAVVLLHGFPHTWQVWSGVMGRLAGRFRVVAPDLRGFGDSERAVEGYDAGTLAADVEGVLDVLGEPSAAVVGIDAGAAPAVLLALRRPGRVRRLVVMEALLGRLPGAEDVVAGGAPWWFGFHAVPGLAETVLVGNEASYVDWFLRSGTLGRGVPDDIRAAFVHAYTGSEALRCAFSYYRALPTSARQLQDAVSTARLTMPTMAVGSQPVGTGLERQLRPLADDLVGHHLQDCGHIIPLDRPDALFDLLGPFLCADLAG
ncbi:MAG TPA: alpha/beta hydrolase [Streptomyces sp.]